jgi:beta-glucosidase
VSVTFPPPVAGTSPRVERLLATLSLPQKLGQLVMGERACVTPDDVRTHHLGTLLSGAGSFPGENTVADWVAMHDAYWMAAMDDAPGRVPVPLLYAVDAVHGHAAVRGATVFPQHVGLGAAHDPDLVERVAAVCAREVLVTALDWNFAPTLAVARNLRWGRSYESFSDDPALVATYAARVVRGMQGTLRDDGVLACAKHWLGDGATTFGEDQGDVALPLEALRAVDLLPYRAALDAGVLTVMASFNSWQGTKCHGSHALLTGLLKGELGFRGLVVSDWDGVDQLHPDRTEAAALALNAGVDVLMVSADWRGMLAAVAAAVAAGTVPLARIDDAVRRVLWVKEQAGLFERPRPAARRWAHHPSFGSSMHRTVAREAVRKSCVLLAHDGAVLPIVPGRRVLVAGRLADDRGAQCGGFTIAWQGVRGNDAIAGGTSVWEAIRAEAPGAELSLDGSAADPARHDVAVVVIGEHPYAEGQGDIRTGRVASGAALGLPCAELVPYGPSLELAARHPEDLATIEGIAARGIPVVTVLLSGRPVVANREIDRSSAFIAAWLPGSEAQGIADLLFGTDDFQGRLPFPWPARMGVDADAMGCRFPRGYGLTVAGTATADTDSAEARRASSSRRTTPARASVIG